MRTVVQHDGSNHLGLRLNVGRRRKSRFRSPRPFARHPTTTTSEKGTASGREKPAFPPDATAFQHLSITVLESGRREMTKKGAVFRAKKSPPFLAALLPYKHLSHRRLPPPLEDFAEGDGGAGGGWQPLTRPPLCCTPLSLQHAYQ